MVRLLLLFWGMLMGPLCFGAEALYLTNAEKALVGFALKSAQELSQKKNQVDIIEYQKRFAELAEKFKAYQDTDPTIVSVSSFEDFLKLQKEHPLLNDYRLDEIDSSYLLELVKPVRYQSNSMRLQKKIEAYEARRMLQIQRFLSALGLQAFKLNQGRSLDLDSLKFEMKQVFDRKVSELTQDLNGNDSLQVKILEKLLISYFKNLPDSQKFEILFRISHLPLQTKPLDILLTMIQNSGPQMQKLIQIMGRSEHVPQQFQDIFQRLESGVRPVPWWKVRKLLLAQNLRLEDFTYFERKPVGVGTMAQTHRAQYYDEAGLRKSIVVRFLKPDVEKFLEMDHQILKVIALEIDADPELQKYDLPSLADLVEDMHNSVVEELNVQATVEQQKLGQKIYSRAAGIVSFNGQKNHLRFYVPDVKNHKYGNGIMIQELVVGQKPTKELQQYKEIYPDLYRVISEKIAEIWIEEAFFKSGFFHADLHQGNLLASYSDKEIDLFLLDFGMTGQLSKSLRESALLLALGIKLERAGLITKHFLRLGKVKNPEMKGPELSRLVQSRINDTKINPGLGGSLEAWTAWALDLGIEFEYEFLKLNRGLTAIEGLLSDSKSSISTEKLAQNIALRNKAFMAQLLMNEPLLKMSDIGRLTLSVFDQEKKSNRLSVGLRCQALF